MCGQLVLQYFGGVKNVQRGGGGGGGGKSIQCVAMYKERVGGHSLFWPSCCY